MEVLKRFSDTANTELSRRLVKAPPSVEKAKSWQTRTFFKLLITQWLKQWQLYLSLSRLQTSPPRQASSSMYTYLLSLNVRYNLKWKKQRGCNSWTQPNISMKRNSKYMKWTHSAQHMGAGQREERFMVKYDFNICDCSANWIMVIQERVTGTLHCLSISSVTKKKNTFSSLRSWYPPDVLSYWLDIICLGASAVIK